MGADEKPSLDKNTELNISVIFLDDSVDNFKLKGRCTGGELLNLVNKKLGVFHRCYFDLAYLDFEGNHCWLDHSKPLLKLARSLNNSSLDFLFSVKYYIPHPNLIIDDLTRYLFALQIKRDFFRGLLHSNRNTSLLLAAFIVQSELGDYDESECRSFAYLRKHHLLRSAPESYLMRVFELHQNLVGLTKSEADFHLLDAARKVELYGVRLHPVTHMNEQPYNLSVTHAGISVFRNFTRVGGFGWSRIRKLSFKRKKFVIQLNITDQFCPKDCAEYMFHSQNACKNFWKKCIEQHHFFRSAVPYLANEDVGLPHLNVFGMNAHSTSLPILRQTATSSRTPNMAVPLIPSSHDQSISEAVYSSGDHVYRLNTPVKHFARLRQRASSLRWSKSPNSKMLSDDYLSSSSLSLKQPGWMPNDYTHPVRKPGISPRMTGMNRLSTLSPRASEEHFQLLRLSFTSLNQLEPTNEYGSTLPSCKRFGEMPRTRRSASTPVITETMGPRKSVASHSFVPRCFHAPGRSAFLCEHGLVVTGNTSSGSLFPPRPTVGNEEFVEKTDTPTTNKGSEDSREIEPTLHKSVSSSCSLYSPGESGLASNAKYSNGEINIQSGSVCFEAKSRSTGNLKSTEFSSHSLEKSSLSTPPHSFNLGQITSPCMYHLEDTDSQSSSSSRIDFACGSDEHFGPFRVSGVERSQSVPSLSVSDKMDNAELGTGPDEILTLHSGDPADFGQFTYERSESITKHLALMKDDNAIPCKGSNSENLAITLESLNVLPVTQEASSECKQSNKLTKDAEQLESPPTCSQDVTSRRLSISDIFSASSNASSAVTSHIHGMPESLADALSLGAISMLTSVSCYDSSGDAHRKSTSALPSVNPVTSSVSSFKSLKLLGRGYWGVSESSSDDAEFLLTSGKRLRARSAVSVNPKQRKRIRRRMPLSVENEFKYTKMSPRLSTNDVQVSTNETIEKEQPKTEKQAPLHILGKSYYLQNLQSVYYHETAYCNMLRFFCTYKAQLAKKHGHTELADWINARLKPALQPLIQKHSTICQAFQTSLEILESSHDNAQRPRTSDQSIDQNPKWDANKENNQPPGIGQIMIDNIDLIKLYNDWFGECATLLTELWQLGYGDLLDRPMDRSTVSQPHTKMRTILEEIDLHKHSPLSLINYLLLPGRHMRHYCVMLGALAAESDRESVLCKVAFGELIQAARGLYPTYRYTEQLALVLQFAHRVLPIHQFLTPGECTSCDLATFHPKLRMFGWLRKFSRRGFQPRMVFLFGDRLLYASRIGGLTGVFLKIHGYVCLCTADVTKEIGTTTNTYQENVEKTQSPGLNSIESCSKLFAITVRIEKAIGTSGNPCSVILRRKILFMAPTEDSRDMWVTELKSLLHENSSNEKLKMCAHERAIKHIDDSVEIKRELSQLTHRQSDLRLPSPGTASVINTFYSPNTLLDVCWRRRLTFTSVQLINSNDSSLAGPLYRKLKHTPKWQKLWVILVDFRMIFYKNARFDEPQATLTLPGYKVRVIDTLPDSENGTESIIELSFKAKHYWFRAESNVFLLRWFHALSALLACNESNATISTSGTMDDQTSSLRHKTASENLLNRHSSKHAFMSQKNLIAISGPIEF